MQGATAPAGLSSCSAVRDDPRDLLFLSLLPMSAQKKIPDFQKHASSRQCVTTSVITARSPVERKSVQVHRRHFAPNLALASWAAIRPGSGRPESGNSKPCHKKFSWKASPPDGLRLFFALGCSRLGALPAAHPRRLAPRSSSSGCSQGGCTSSARPHDDSLNVQTT